MKNFSYLEEHLLDFLKTEVDRTGYNSVIIGVSGGLDSAVTSILLKKAFDENVKAVMLPSEYSNRANLKDAKTLCEKFNIDYEIKPITDLVNVYFKDKKSTPLEIGNFSARMRMATLYDLSANYRALVIGTSNKSEIALGYGTLYGDLACAINPIGDIYKSDLFEFAKYLGVIDEIINKPPSADLWVGQSDEEELGFSYAQIDEVLRDFIDKNLNQKELLKKGHDKKLVEMIIKRYEDNEFKRHLPIMAKIDNNKFENKK